MPNESKRLSSAGWADLRHREGAVMNYYNDVANNCTYGVGTLAHLGFCSAEELQRPVSIAQVNAQLATKVRLTEQIVRSNVRDHELTQDQFDALVSFAYNSGESGSRDTFVAANSGNNALVASNMALCVYVHPRDAQGHRLPPRRVNGLVNRRREEAAPFKQGVR
ncbi:glycoside hydrolase family protein [Paraburkholderia lacunae]|uniref:Lysozyme n=1 Tax=Paraburkholderia lacunae TaxID=2211104 RepID=A0A370MX80_9BURK|nr:glycoside hydrolase family protein [Paraburkholderia lacunae]RDJ97787.1 lysozyme [Paraburkholderia lacunae]